MATWQGSSNSPAPFLVKTYDMVDDPSTNSVVSWSESGCSFVVWNVLEFARDLLPMYFKHNNFSSFVRQLNTYGFRKIDPEQWEFSNEKFIRGQRHRLTNIQRRKPVHSHSVRNQVPLSEKERQEYKEEINKLKHDNSLLRYELRKHEVENNEFEFRVLSLVERLRNLESRQMKLISSIKVLLSQFCAYGEKRRFLEANPFDYEADAETDETVNFQNLKQIGTSLPLPDLEQIKRLESSLRMWESVVHVFGDPTRKEISNPEASSKSFPPIDSDPEDVSFLPCLPNSDTSSSSGKTQSTNHIDNIPEISSMHLDINTRPSSSTVEVNNKVASAHETEAFREQEAVPETAATVVAQNDHFWQQFLTEYPSVSDPQEMKSERGTLMAT